jgi:hypoxanthine phosphoribosyltransferase
MDREVLFTEEAVNKRIADMAFQISKDYAGKDLVLVCVLKGAVFFTSELAKRLTIPATVDFVQVSSYGADTSSSGNVKFKKDLDTDIKGRSVLLVEDIVDTGTTARCLMERLREKHPSELKFCALLDKKARRKTDVKIDYLGFDVPDKFIVGYGLDLNDKFRNLPYISAVNENGEQND